jgi:hypothetical protein|tara:strand:+ start:154 stop:285 length:132 start_codon:yes stop_codon:yes gene_type:complete
MKKIYGDTYLSVEEEFAAINKLAEINAKEFLVEIIHLFPNSGN